MTDSDLAFRGAEDFDFTDFTGVSLMTFSLLLIGLRCDFGAGYTIVYRNSRRL
jgi:hypothetical protein